MIPSPLYFALLTSIYLAAWWLHVQSKPAWGKTVLAVGVARHALFMGLHAGIAGEFVWNSLLDPPFLLPLLVALILLFLPWQGAENRLQIGYTFGLLVATTVFSAFYPQGIIPPAANKSGWSPCLVFWFVNCAYALFGTAGMVALPRGWTADQRHRARRLLALGFVSFSIAQVVGALWSFLGWGHPFMWGSRHLGSAAIWLIFAAVIHLRFLPPHRIPERMLTISASLLALYVFYSHLVFEMGIPRIGGN